MHKITRNYFVAGIIFGMMFPIIGTIVQLVEVGGPLSVSKIIQIHINSSLLWIIDLAPLVLGGLAYYLGLKQTKLFILTEELKVLNSTQSVDITNLNSALKQKADDLQQMSYTTNHDLKSTLRGIASLGTFIEQETDSEEKKNLHNLLDKRIARMDNLLDSILNFSKLTNEKNKFEKVDLIDSLKEIIKTKSRNINYDSDGFTEIIHLDRKKAEAALNELVENAVKFTPIDQQLSIKTEIENIGPYVRFSFEDNGPGIDEKYRDKVFVPFSTLEARDKDENLGMGLAMVKRLINDMGGEIDLCSAPGTKFEIKLPNNN